MVKRQIPLILLLPVLLSLGGCDSEPHLQPLPEQAVILSFGNSLTYGTGAAQSQSYPAQLAQLSGRNVINAGVPGEVSREGRQRLAELLDQHRPQLLLLCHGGNDLLRKLDKTALRSNLEAMIQMAQARGIDVVLIAPPGPSLLLSVDPLYTELAEQYQLVLEDSILRQVLLNNALKSDPIHPNAKGYRLIAETLSQRLRGSGAL